MKMKKATLICTLGLSAALLGAACVSAADVESAAESTAESMASGVESVAEAPEQAERPDFRALDFTTLGEYKGLTVEVDPVEITDEDIDARIDAVIHSSDEGSDEFTEGTVEEGDIANIDFEGKKDGVAFEGGTSQGYDLEIGSGTFIPGFEEGLVGAAIGDTVDLDVTFPENYGNEELAGQPVVFTVTINSVKRLKEMSDELADALSDGEAKTIADYRELIKGELTESALEESVQNAKSQLLSMVADNLTVEEYPQDLVDYTVGEIKTYFENYAAMYGVDFATFLQGMFGMTEEQFPEEAEMLAKENLKSEFAVDAIAEIEKLLPDEGVLKEAYDKLAEQYGFQDGESMVAMYGEDSVNSALEQELVLDFLYDNANIVERQPEVESGAESMAESVAETTVVEDVLEADSAEEEAE